MRSRDQHSRGDSRLSEDCLASTSIQRRWKLKGSIRESTIIHPAKLGVGRDVWYSQVPCVYVCVWGGTDPRREAFEEGQVCTQAPGEPNSAKHRPHGKSLWGGCTMQPWEALTGGQGTHIAWGIQVGSCARGKRGKDQVTVKSLLWGQLEPYGHNEH